MLTQYGAKDLLGKLSGLFVGLSSTKPNIDGTGVTEPTASSYYRHQIYRINQNDSFSSVMSAAVNTATGAKVSNSKTLYFAETYDNTEGKVEDWGELKYVCIFSAKTGGSLYAFDELPTPIHPGAGGVSNVALIRKGDLTIEIANPTT